MGGSHPLAPGDLPGVPSAKIGISDEVLIVSRPAQMGWIEQVSPACAAASVAGALNGLLNLQTAKSGNHEHQGRRVSQADVLQHYAVATSRNFANGVRGLSLRLRVQDEDIGDMSHAILSHPSLHKLLTHPIGEDGAMKWQGLGKKPLQSALHSLAGLPEGFKGRHRNGAGDDSQSEDGDLEEALSDAAHRAKPTKLTPKIKDALASALKDDEGETVAAVHEYLLAEADLFDVTSTPDGKLLPSTSSIGTNQWIGALEHVGESFGLGNVEVEELLSSSNEHYPRHVVTVYDPPEVFDKQWKSVVDALRDAVVLYHMSDHYSLVFAARAWKTTSAYGGLASPGVPRVSHVRQLLVAKPGQMPSTWLDFEYVLDEILESPDYVLVAVSQKV